MNFGIDAISIHIPKIYLDISELAKVKGDNAEKLKRGLGLDKIALCDKHEDVCTMASNALLELIEKNDIDPLDIERIYVGTESGVDSSKPISSYVLEMIETKLSTNQNREIRLEHCDVVDLTFACIGGVDALQNSLDWVRSNPEKIGVIICTDIAKYEENSSGEYTQGAGAIAMLIKKKPRLLEIQNQWGVSTQSVHDFFKPRDRYNSEDLLDQISQIVTLNTDQKKLLQKSLPFLKNKTTEIFKHTPVVQGNFSHQCYKERTYKALLHFKKLKGCGGLEHYIDHWEQIIFHLPYAFQGQRVFGESFLLENQKNVKILDDIESQLKIKIPKISLDSDLSQSYLALNSLARSLHKSKVYQDFITDKISKTQIASSQVGNIYTGSLFLSLISYLSSCVKEGKAIAGKKIGFISYGSGSKSKVFEAKIALDYESQTKKIDLFKKLEKRFAIDHSTYQKIHREELMESIQVPRKEFVLKKIEFDRTEIKGARTYQWVS